MKFPLFPKKKADTISNGVFFILIGILFYTGQWWPGILFALGLTFAIRQYLTGRKVGFFMSILLIGLLGILTLIGHVFSFFFPLIFIVAGLYLIAKECLTNKRPSFWKTPSNSEHFKE